MFKHHYYFAGKLLWIIWSNLLFPQRGTCIPYILEGQKQHIGLLIKKTKNKKQKTKKNHILMQDVLLCMIA